MTIRGTTLNDICNDLQKNKKIKINDINYSEKNIEYKSNNIFKDILTTYNYDQVLLNHLTGD